MKSNEMSNKRFPVSLKVFLYTLAAMFAAFFVVYLGRVVMEVWEPLRAISKEIIAEVFNEATIWLCVAVAFGATLITAVVRVVGANQPAKNSNLAKGEQPKLGAGAKGQHQSSGKFCAPRSAGMPLEHDQAS